MPSEKLIEGLSITHGTRLGYGPQADNLPPSQDGFVPLAKVPEVLGVSESLVKRVLRDELPIRQISPGRYGCLRSELIAWAKSRPLVTERRAERRKRAA